MSAEARRLILDITRLVARTGPQAPTGIDRVERAYLAELAGRGAGNLHLACRTALGWLLIPGSVAPDLLRWIDGPHCLPLTGPLATALARNRRTPAIEAALRARSHLCLTLPALARQVAAGSGGGSLVWLTVGHMNLSVPLFRRLKRLPGLRIVAMLHDTIPLDHPDWSGPGASDRLKDGLRAAFAHADLILTPSAAAAGDLQRWAGLSGHRIDPLVVPLGVTPAAPRPDLVPPDLRPDRPYFVALGTIEPRKDHALLLDIWDGFRAAPPPGHAPALLVLGRRGWAAPALFARLDRALPLVRVAGGLPDGAVSALLQGAQALLAPSRAEGFGLPVAEAAALGVPVIASDLAVTREVAGDWPVYLTPGDLYAWQDAIITMARQADSRQGRPAPAKMPDWQAHFNLVFSRL